MTAKKSKTQIPDQSYMSVELAPNGQLTVGHIVDSLSSARDELLSRALNIKTAPTEMIKDMAVVSVLIHALSDIENAAGTLKSTGENVDKYFDSRVDSRCARPLNDIQKELLKGILAAEQSAFLVGKFLRQGDEARSGIKHFASLSVSLLRLHEKAAKRVRRCSAKQASLAGKDVG